MSQNDVQVQSIPRNTVIASTICLKLFQTRYYRAATIRSCLQDDFSFRQFRPLNRDIAWQRRCLNLLG